MSTCGVAASGPDRCSRPGRERARELAPVPENGLCDPFGRRVTYLRLSLTERCNFSCTYCPPMAEAGAAALPPSLSRSELVGLARAFVSAGVSKVRLTGGEPTLHPELTGIVADLAALPNAPILALTTNGLLLPRLARPLRSAGLARVNVSLDSLSRETFAAMTGRDRLDAVREGLEAALEAGFERVKVNAVILAGVNEGEIEALARLAETAPVDVRFIELMPFGGDSRGLTAAEVERRLAGILPMVPEPREALDGPARMVRVPGWPGRIGFIEPFSVRFCSDCNRLRVTARGALRLCLLGGGETDLVGPLRRGATDGDLVDLVRRALAGKAERHTASPGQALPACGTPMRAVGG